MTQSKVQLGSLFFFVFTAILLTGQPLKAQGCNPLDESYKQQQHPLTHSVRRNMMEKLTQNNLPGFRFKTEKNGEVPVMKIDHDTLPHYQDVMKESVGFQIALVLTKSEYDHSVIRIGDHLFDLFRPGAREHGRGEINENGVAVRDTAEYMRIRKANSRRIVEMVFPMEAPARAKVMLYHLVRRANLFRVRWSWHNEADVAKYAQYPHYLHDAPAEHCFHYTTNQHHEGNINALNNALNRLNSPASRWLLEQPPIKQFIERATKQLLEADMNDNSALHYRMFDRAEYIGLLDSVLPEQGKGFHPSQKVEILSYLMSIHAIKNFKEVLDKHQIFPDRVDTIDYENSNLAGVFVWETHPDTSPGFYSGKYEFGGVKAGIFYDPARSLPIERP